MIIVRAAIMFSNGEIVEGHDYGHITSISHKLSIAGDKIYGFITSKGDFVLPADATAIAVKANQIPQTEEPLKPEDIWPEYVME